MLRDLKFMNKSPKFEPKKQIPSPEAKTGRNARLTPYNHRFEAAMDRDMTTQEVAAEEKENPSSALSLRSPAEYAVGSIPTVLYVPDFISQTEQSQLLHHVLDKSGPFY
jgi:hypothetical protein